MQVDEVQNNEYRYKQKEAEKKGMQNPKSILKKKAVRFKETKRIPKTAE